MSFGIPPQPQGPQGPQRPLAPYPQSQDDGLGLIVPINVKNGLAVVSGYLGIFSIFMGPLLGIPAVITGILALRKPELGGQGRAWTGIFLGALTSLGYFALVVFIVLRTHK